MNENRLLKILKLNTFINADIIIGTNKIKNRKQYSFKLFFFKLLWYPPKHVIISVDIIIPSLQHFKRVATTIETAGITISAE